MSASFEAPPVSEIVSKRKAKRIKLQELSSEDTPAKETSQMDSDCEEYPPPSKARQVKSRKKKNIDIETNIQDDDPSDDDSFDPKKHRKNFPKDHSKKIVKSFRTRQRSSSGPKSLYIYNLIEDFTVLELSQDFASRVKEGKAISRSDFFLEKSKEMKRGIQSISKRLEKLEGSGNFAAFAIFFFCTKFKQLASSRRIIITDLLKDYRVTPAENLNGKIPEVESEYLEFLKDSFTNPSLQNQKYLLEIVHREQDEESLKINSEKGSDPYPSSQNISKFIEKILNDQLGLIERQGLKKIETISISNANSNPQALEETKKVEQETSNDKNFPILMFSNEKKEKEGGNVPESALKHSKVPEPPEEIYSKSKPLPKEAELKKEEKLLSSSKERKVRRTGNKEMIKHEERYQKTNISKPQTQKMRTRRFAAVSEEVSFDQKRSKSEKPVKLLVSRDLNTKELRLLDLVFERACDFFKTDRQILMKKIGLRF